MWGRRRAIVLGGAPAEDLNEGPLPRSFSDGPAATEFSSGAAVSDFVTAAPGFRFAAAGHVALWPG